MTTAAALAVVALAVGVAACGGSDGDSEASVGTTANDGHIRVPASVYASLPDGIAVVDLAERPLTEVDDRLVRTALLLEMRSAELRSTVTGIQLLGDQARDQGYAVDLVMTGLYPVLEGKGPDGTARFGSLSSYLVDEARKGTEGAIRTQFQKAAQGRDVLELIVAEFDPKAR